LIGNEEKERRLEETRGEHKLEERPNEKRREEEE